MMENILNHTLAAIVPVDQALEAKAQARLDRLTKPLASLGRLEEFARRFVAITENSSPVLDKKVIFTFAGDHGVADEGVSLFPKEVTRQMVMNFLAGGAEIGGIAGLCLGAAVRRIPVVVDGFISTAGALIAHCLAPRVKDYLFAAHNSVEIGHGHMLTSLGLKPILDLDLRLGEGTGAALAMLMIEAGLKIYKEMATFDEAKVSKS